MTFSNLNALPLIGILFLVTLVHCQKYKCPSEGIDKLDELTARFMSLTKFQRNFPETHSQINGYCKTIKDDISQMNDQINACLTGTAKQFGSVILYSYKTTVKQYCNAKQKKRIESMVVMAKCMNRNTDSGHTCLAKYIDAVQRGKRAEPNSSRIGYACCDYFKFLTCLESVTKTSCSEDETEKIQEFLRNVFSGIIDVACGDYTENSDKCDKLPVPPKKKRSDKSYRTYFMPLVELWHTL